MPLPGRFLTSLCVRHKGDILMIDAGEGTQVTMKLLGWGFKNISTICFTHFHADHISGLPGLLLTIGNSNRTETLRLIGPRGLRRVATSLLVIAPELPFGLEFVELDARTPNSLDMGEGLKIKTHPMQHHVACMGYCLELERLGKFDVERAKSLGLPRQLWGRLQKGERLEYEGFSYTPQMVLGEVRKGIKLCYCTDSRPVEGLPEFVQGADLFVCEGLYGENDKLPKAIEHKHMIFSEAAAIAAKAKVQELWLTHFSPALVSPQAFLRNATDIFENTRIGKDRMTKTLMFEE